MTNPILARMAKPLPDDRDRVEAVLVVDDSRAQRRILSSCLKRWGYRVFEASSGAEALRLSSMHKIDLVISDWVMPGMSGLDFCKAFRARDGGRYGYFILLTSKSDKSEVACGLDVGADDFLTKPIAATELRARLHAGERVLRMERELTEKNRIITNALDQISALYDVLDRDLIEARRLQQSLVRDRHHDLGTARITLLLRPSGRVGGDLVGYFPINTDSVGFFSIDVSGHGITAALLAARLAGHFSGSSAGQNLALKRLAGGGFAPRSPSAVAQHLNALMLKEMETDHYCTLLLGNLDLTSGRMVFAQCGCPHPVVQRVCGPIEQAGAGGLPIGLLPDALWSDVVINLRPGDRVLIPSDGITELPDVRGKMLDDPGILALLAQNSHLTGPAFFEALIWQLNDHAGDAEFPDDVSAILLDFTGMKAGTAS